MGVGLLGSEQFLPLRVKRQRRVRTAVPGTLIWNALPLHRSTMRRSTLHCRILSMLREGSSRPLCKRVTWTTWCPLDLYEVREGGGRQ